MKKQLKKLAAVVALAAVFCTMTTPGTASAAKCTHSRMLLGTVLLRTTFIDTHPFSYYQDFDDDGIREIITDFCTISEEEHAYVKICASCGYSEPLPNSSSFTVITHSEAGNPYHDGTY